MRNNLLLALSLSQLLACTSGDEPRPVDNADDPGSSGGTSGGIGDSSSGGIPQWIPVPAGAPHVDVGTDSTATTSTDTKVHIRSDNPPLLVVFRDGPTAAWQAATQVTPSHYQAVVHGPYQVGVVCETGAVMVADRFHVDELRTWEVARTPDDPRDLVPPCDNQPFYNGIGGTAPPSTIIQTGALAVLADPGGHIVTGAELGTRDVIASNADKILIQRGLLIGFGVTPSISLASLDTGRALKPVRLGVPHIRTGETVQAAVHVRTATTDTNADISVSPAQTSEVLAVGFADVKVAPDAVLSEPGDVQTVEVSSRLGSSLRTLRRAFTLAGDSDFQLPPAISDGAIAFTGNQVRASWSSLPETTVLHLVVDGRTTDQFPFARYELHVSNAYLQAVQPTSVAIDTQVPGYQAAWRVDPAQGNTRTFSAQNLDGDDVATSAIIDVTP